MKMKNKKFIRVFLLGCPVLKKKSSNLNFSHVFQTCYDESTNLHTPFSSNLVFYYAGIETSHISQKITKQQQLMKMVSVYRDTFPIY